MDAVRKLDSDLALPFALKEMIGALDAIGYSLLPLCGSDGKTPSMKFMNARRFPLDLIGERMATTGSESFGIRCAGLVVVDIDATDVGTIDRCCKRFGPTPFTVKTRNGVHCYYRQGAAKISCADLRPDGIDGDIKAGCNSYIVAPGSRRPDNGFVYSMDGEPLPPIGELPLFHDSQARDEAPTRRLRPAVVGIDGHGVRKSTRWNSLTAKAREFARHVASESDLTGQLREYARAKFETMTDFPDSKIVEISHWTWQRRCEGNLWGGSNSKIQIRPEELAALSPAKGCADAMFLLLILRQAHAAQPGKRFAVSGRAMAMSGIVPGWSKDKYYAAKNILVEYGLLKIVEKPRRDRPFFEYQLSTLKQEAV